MDHTSSYRGRRILSDRLMLSQIQQRKKGSRIHTNPWQKLRKTDILRLLYIIQKNDSILF